MKGLIRSALTGLWNRLPFSRKKDPAVKKKKDSVQEAQDILHDVRATQSPVQRKKILRSLRIKRKIEMKGQTPYAYPLAPRRYGAGSVTGWL